MMTALVAIAADAPKHDHLKNLPEVPAFPGAQGAGAMTPGGRGGTVYKVTSLADYGSDQEPIPGTLRYAVKQEGPRSVVFAVGGTLRLKRPLVISRPYLTVAGNTAPFPGITICAYPTSVRADHVILRYLRFRLDVAIMRERFEKGLDSGWDTVGGSRCEYVVFDHISGSHSVDETISFSGEIDHVTLSHSISAYSLRSIFHDYYFTRGPDYRHTQTHNLGGLMAYMGKHDAHAMASSIHNVWAHHDRRMPGMSAGRNDSLNMMAYIDIRNSVMYNWKSNAAGIETGDVERSRYHVNLVGNYFKPGKNTPENRRDAGLTVMGHNRVYLAGNVHDDDVKAGRTTPQEKLLLDQGRLKSGKRTLEEPLPTPPVETVFPSELKALANSTVGASLPTRDSVDAQAIQDIFDGTGHHPFVDMEQDDSPPVPILPFVRQVYASEKDMFPVWWKLSQNLAADAHIDPLADADGDGFTNIEAYMHGLPLKTHPTDWRKPENNNNPLERFENHLWAPAPSAADFPGGWSDREEGETIYVHPDGLVVLASSTDDDGLHGCKSVLEANGSCWTPGTGAKRFVGPNGANDPAGTGLVLAFPMPQRLQGIRIAKPHPEAYAAAHDPFHIRVQGLRGWPDHWEDLAEIENLPPFAEGKTAHDIIIPEDTRAFFPAYRILFMQTRGDLVRIQYLSPLP